MGVYTLGSHLFGIRKPINVMISVTNRCNSRCSYCNIFNRNQRELTESEIINLLDILKKEGTQRIALWGGEPLIREDIGRIIDHAKNKLGFFISVDTNGYLVPQKLDILKNIDVLVFSFDGCQNIHDENREKGSYAKVMKAIEIALQNNINVFTITVLTKKNIGDLEFICETAKNKGFSNTFQVLHHSSELASENESSYMPENAEYKNAINKIIDYKKKGYPIVSSFQYLNYLLEWPDYKKSTSVSKSRLKCFAGKLYCNIDTDGSIYPCSVMIGQMPSKNFLADGFKDAFDFTKNVECQSCNASCFTEYNFMHSFNLGVIYNWLTYTKK